MSSDQIRTALLRLHQERGKLSHFCRDNQLNYATVFRFMTTPGRQLEHDTALAVINALPQALKVAAQEAA